MTCELTVGAHSHNLTVPAPPALASAAPGALRGWRRFRGWAVAMLLGGLLAGGAAAAVARLDDPKGFLNGLVLATARIAAPTLELKQLEEEYLVFLTEDTKAARQRLFAGTHAATYLGDSLLPAVIVVHLNGDKPAALAELRRQDLVRLVVLYNPSFGCH